MGSNLKTHCTECPYAPGKNIVMKFHIEDGVVVIDKHSCGDVMEKVREDDRVGRPIDYLCGIAYVNQKPCQPYQEVITAEGIIPY